MNRLFKRVCALSLAALLLPGAAGATGTVYHNLLSLTVAAVGSEDPNLSPLTCRDRDMHSLMALCYEGLVALDDDGRPVPALAERWDPPTDSNRRWTFHLRTDVVFHNGEPFTSADVVATFNRIFELGQYDDKRVSNLPGRSAACMPT